MSTLFLFTKQNEIDYFNKLDNFNTLIVGDSHTQTAFIPSKIGKSINISQPGETYIITYWKINKFLEHKKFDTIIIGFAQHNISSFNDYKFEDKKWSQEMLSRSIYFMNLNDLYTLPINYIDLFTCYIISHIKFPPDIPKYVGEFTPIKKTNLRDTTTAINSHYYYKELGLAKINLNYLDSIISLCQKESIELVFVGTPVHKKYYSKIPDYINHSYDSLINSISNSGMTVFNYTHLNLNDSLFSNLDHLNLRGAKFLTNTFINDLNNINYSEIESCTSN